MRFDLLTLLLVVIIGMICSNVVLAGGNGWNWNGNGWGSRSFGRMGWNRNFGRFGGWNGWNGCGGIRC